MKNHSKFATFTMTSSCEVCGKTFEDGSSMATQDSSKPGGFVSWRQPKRGEEGKSQLWRCHDRNTGNPWDTGTYARIIEGTLIFFEGCLAAKFELKPPKLRIQLRNMGIWLGDFSCKTWVFDQNPPDIAGRFFKRTKHSIVNHRAQNINVHTPAYIRPHMENMHTNQKSGSSWCVMYVHIYILIRYIPWYIPFLSPFYLTISLPPVTLTTPNKNQGTKGAFPPGHQGSALAALVGHQVTTSQLVSALRPRMCPPLSALEATILASTRLQVEEFVISWWPWDKITWNIHAT